MSTYLISLYNKDVRLAGPGFTTQDDDDVDDYLKCLKRAKQHN